MDDLSLARLLLAAKERRAPDDGDYYDHGPLRVVRSGPVLAIIGSHNLWGWLQNFDMQPVALAGYGKVHRGWLDAASTLKYWGRADDAKIIVGHSYGAAVALILGVLIYPEQPDIQVVQFSPPSCGDKEFCSNIKFPVKRIWVHPDIITCLPFFYTHVGEPTPLKGTLNLYRNHLITTIIDTLNERADKK